MTLTQSQQDALKAFENFLKSGDQVLILKGAAGTGKTTLVGEMLKILQAKNQNYHLMAPTGRAAFIIGKKTSSMATTIHKAIYSLQNLQSTSRNNGDEDDGVHIRFTLKNNKESLQDIYFVDESSMVSDAFSESEDFSFGGGCLLTDLFQFVQGRKIVFIGDYAQLPPVGMDFSPALNNAYLENKFGCNVAEIILDEVLRQSHESVMLHNATRIRKCIENKTFIEFKLDKGADSVAEDVNLLSPYYELSAKKPSSKAIVITFSNKKALDYNLAIRRHYFGADAPRLLPNDLLMVCRNNYSHGVELFNGNIVLVESCQPDSEVEERVINVPMGQGRTERVQLRFRRATIRFATCEKVETLNVMLLDNFLDDPSSTIGGVLARALIIDFNTRLPEKFKVKLSEIRHVMKLESPTSEQKEMCDAYLKYMANDPYYNALIFKYGYAITCHKAQGGEWDYVFVDMSRYGGTANDDYFRWAYTALTRASKKIWHFCSPEFSYISNLVVEEVKPAPKIKVSIYSEDSDFCAARLSRIHIRALDMGLTVTDDRTKPYQHLITFVDNKGNRADFQLWYNAHNYSGKEVLVSSSSDELTTQCRSILDATFAPDEVPFAAPNRPFAEKLVTHIRKLLDEVGIQLLDITQEAYQDVFHLKTDGIAQVALTYTAKGNYTYMRLISSLGTQDAKLMAFRKRF